MDSTKIAFMASAINFMLKYGVPAARLIIEELADKRELTLEDIDHLAVLLKEPESYFDK